MRLWALEEETALRGLIETGISGGQVAKALTEQFNRTFNRSMVNAKAARMNCHFGSRGKGHSNPIPKRKLKPPKPVPALIPQPVLVKAVVVPTNPCTIWELKRGRCRYPLWPDECRADTNFFYCGSPANGSYCPYHSVVTYRTEMGRFNHKRLGIISTGLFR